MPYRWYQAEDTRCPDDPLKAAALIEPAHHEDRPFHQARMGEQSSLEHPSPQSGHEGRRPAGGVRAPLGRASRLQDQRTDGHADRARNLACPAVEAVVHLRGEVVVWPETVLGDGANELRPAPGRFPLETGGDIGRAYRQACAALDAELLIGQAPT